MSLFAHNLTTSPITLVGVTPVTVLPAARAPGGQGEAFNVTGDFIGLSPAQFAALEAQAIVNGVVRVKYEWENGEEFPTPGLTTHVPGEQGATGAPGAPGAPGESAIDAGPDLIMGTEDDVYPVLSLTAIFNEPNPETGLDRAIPLFSESCTPYKLRILQVLCTITRGATDAVMYLCCHPGGGHEPHSERFSATSPGQYHETSMLADRVIEAGEDLYAYCSRDYVLGRITVMYQRIKE